MSSFIPSTIQDKINALITQITNVYKAFIQHTQTFFVDSNGNATISSNENINLNSNSNSSYSYELCLAVCSTSKNFFLL